MGTRCGVIGLALLAAAAALPGTGGWTSPRVATEIAARLGADQPFLAVYGSVIAAALLGVALLGGQGPRPGGSGDANRR